MWFEEFLAEVFIRGAHDWFCEHPADALVAVPLFPVKERQRGFNQAERLGRALSKAAGVPLSGRVLERTTDTRTQTRLSRSERAENVRRAFALKGHLSAIKDRRIVLVDDVLTTGATANAAARVLRRHGAAEVCAWTLARGLLH